MPNISRRFQGEKRSARDAEWIADLLQHGLVRASFVPPRPQRERRDLTRYRSSLAADRARLKSRIQKTLEDTTSKLASVASDSTGQSGRAILQAMLEGEQNPQQLAALARGRMKEKHEQLVQARPRTLGAHHRFLLQSQLRQVDFFEHQIWELDQEIAHRLGVQSGPDDPDTPEPSGTLPATEERSESPVPSASAESIGPLPAQSEAPTHLSRAEAMRLRAAVTGINIRSGEIVVAELGLQMERFPDAAHLCSWVGLCPAAK